jgi:hypothetical protein
VQTFFLLSLGTELRASCFLGKHCTTWVPSSLLLWVCFLAFHTFATTGLRLLSSYLCLLPKWMWLHVYNTMPSLFLRLSLTNFAQAGLEPRSSYLCLLSSWDYWCEPPHLASCASLLIQPCLGSSSFLSFPWTSESKVRKKPLKVGHLSTKVPDMF